MGTDQEGCAAIEQAGIFKRLEEQVNLFSSVQEKQYPAQVVAAAGSKFFVWDRVNSNLLCQSFDHDGDVQTIVPTRPPHFDVQNIELNSEGSVAVVYGKDGVIAIELPDMITSTIRMRNATKSIGAKSFTLGEKIFLRNPSLQVMQVKWHPGSPTDSHLSILTSDSYIRTYDILHPERAPVVVPVGQKAGHAKGAFPSLRSLGEVGVAFDFGPPLATLAEDIESTWLWPVFVIFGNGEVYMFYSSIQHSKENLSAVQGPLLMRPQTEDNYEGNYCDIICLSLQPLTLALATSDLTVFHCMVLSEYDDEADGGGGESQFQLRRSSSRQLDAGDIRDASTVTYLHVFERVTLSTDVGVSADSDLEEEEFSVRLFKDRFSKFRYFVSHMSGIHGLCLPSLIQLAQALQAKEQPDFSVLQLPSTVEYMLCTQIAGQDPAAPVGLIWLDTFPSKILAVTRDCKANILPIPLSLQIGRHESAGELQTSPTLTKTEDDVDLFSERIKQLLQKKAMQPRLHLTEDEALSMDAQIQLMLRSRDIFWKEYISRLSLASEEVGRRSALLRNRLLGLKEELTLIEDAKQELQREAELIAEQYEDLKERQEGFEKRLMRLYAIVQQFSTGTSQSDAEMRRRLSAFEADLPNIQMGLQRLKLTLGPSNQTRMVPSSRPKLTDAQAASIKETLQTQSMEIRQVMAKMADQAERLSALESSI